MLAIQTQIETLEAELLGLSEAQDELDEVIG